MNPRLLLITVALIAGLSGCQSTWPDWRGEKFDQESQSLSDFGAQFRKPDGQVQPFGITRKSSQIEKSLGVQ